MYNQKIFSSDNAFLRERMARELADLNNFLGRDFSHYTSGLFMWTCIFFKDKKYKIEMVNISYALQCRRNFWVLSSIRKHHIIF